VLRRFVLGANVGVRENLGPALFTVGARHGLGLIAGWRGATWANLIAFPVAAPFVGRGIRLAARPGLLTNFSDPGLGMCCKRALLGPGGRRDAIVDHITPTPGRTIPQWR
jgi:hypothetical protein